MRTMRRGRSQMLFNYLPGKTFDYEGGRAICQVEDYEWKEDGSLNKEFVVRAAAKLIRAWDRAHRRGYPDPVDTVDRYVLARPEEAIARVFPLLFQCTNPNCRRVVSYQEPEHVRASKEGGGVRCRQCHSPLMQLHHVMICNCGHIAPLTVPTCERHGRDHMMLDDQGSQVYANFRWVCRNCNDRVVATQLVRKCDECGEQMAPAVHRASAAFYPQYVSMINLPGPELGRLLGDKDHPALVVAGYLSQELGDVVNLVESGSAQTTVDAGVATFRQFIEQMPAEQRAQFLPQLQAMEDAVRAQASGQRGQLIQSVKPILPEDELERQDMVDELLGYLRPRVQTKDYTVEVLKERAQYLFPERLALYDQYQQEWMRLGLHEVRMIEDFPMTTAVVGFTRGGPKFQKEGRHGRTEHTTLRSFPQKPETPQTPLYVNTVQTEALLFQFDHAEVLHWLQLNEVVHKSDCPPLTDEKGVKAWFLAHAKPVHPWMDREKVDEVSQYVFGLLHSASHLFLRQSVLLSGLDRTSLAEFLFPRALACVTYANVRVDFSLGGLHTLFEQALTGFLRGVYSTGEMCVYDPVCREKDGHCDRCLHISEVSCTHFNRFLSRHYLYGGGTRSDRQPIIGFWDERCRSPKS